MGAMRAKVATTAKSDLRNIYNLCGLVFVVIVCVYIIVGALRFVLTYLHFLRTGGSVEGMVKSNVGSSSIMSKNATIPKIKYSIDGEEIIQIPVRSIFAELFFYEPGERCLIYYSRENRLRFVVKNDAELAINLVSIVVAIFGLLYFLL